jgi:hypothetical protein
MVLHRFDLTENRIRDVSRQLLLDFVGRTVDLVRALERARATRAHVVASAPACRAAVAPLDAHHAAADATPKEV